MPINARPKSLPPRWGKARMGVAAPAQSPLNEDETTPTRHSRAEPALAEAGDGSEIVFTHLKGNTILKCNAVALQASRISTIIPNPVHLSFRTSSPVIPNPPHPSFRTSSPAIPNPVHPSFRTPSPVIPNPPHPSFQTSSPVIPNLLTCHSEQSEESSILNYEQACLIAELSDSSFHSTALTMTGRKGLRTEITFLAHQEED